MVEFFHSTVLPSDVSRRARGTRTVTAQGSDQLALAMAVPMASPHNRPAAYAGLGKPRPFIPVPPKRGVEFRFQEFLDEAANAGPHLGFRIEPIVPIGAGFTVLVMIAAILLVAAVSSGGGG